MPYRYSMCRHMVCFVSIGSTIPALHNGQSDDTKLAKYCMELKTTVCGIFVCIVYNTPPCSFLASR